MRSREPDVSKDTSSVDGPSPASPAPSVTDVPSRGRVWAWALVAGLVAGLIGWSGGEAALDRYRISEEAAGRRFDLSQANLEKRITNARNTAITYGLAGASLGLALGLAGGMARGRLGPSLVGGGVGLVLGGAVGGLPPFVVVPLYLDSHDSAKPSLLLPLLVNGAVWAPVGLAAGLAFGIGLGGRSRIGAALLGGLIGGIVGTAVVEVTHATAFPLARSEQFIPSVGPYARDDPGWERFYLLRSDGSAVASSMYRPGPRPIDHSTSKAATALAWQRLIARFLVPLFIAAGVAWAARARGRAGRGRAGASTQTDRS